MKYNFGGTEIVATTATELVTKMRESAVFDEARTDALWMRVVADRAKNQAGKTVRVDTVEEFIADMIAGGFLIEEGD